MTKSIFRGFFNIIMLTLTAVLLSVSFIACDEDNALNELNPNEKPVPMPTDDLLDANKVNCEWSADSATVATIKDNTLNLSKEKVMAASFKLSYEQTEKDSVVNYNVTLAASVSNYAAIAVDDIKNISGKKFQLKENAFVIGKTTMPVSIQDVKGDVVTFNGKREVFTYTIDGKAPYDLCYASITGAEYALGTPVVVEGMDRTYKVPATITFFATDGENLVYTYDVIASESEKDQVAIVGVYNSIDENGIVSYTITETHTVNVNENVSIDGNKKADFSLNAVEVPEFWSTAAGVVLTSAKELNYEVAGDYSFVHGEDFTGKVNATFVNYITVDYKGNAVKIEIPAAKIANVSIIETGKDESNKEYNKYFYDETYSMIVDNVTIATSLVKLTEKVKKAVEENLSTTDMKDNGDNTGSFDLIDEDGKVVESFRVNLGIGISVSPEVNITSKDLTYAFSTVKPGEFAKVGSYDAGNGVTADKMQRVDNFVFSHDYTERAVVKKHANFVLSYNGKTYQVKFEQNITSSVSLTKGDKSDVNGKVSQLYNAEYKATNGKSSANDNQVITISYEKGANTTTPMVDNGNGTGSFDLNDGDGNKIKTYTVDLGISAQIRSTVAINNQDMGLGLLSSTPGSFSKVGTYSENGVTADKMKRTDVFAYDKTSENLVVTANQNFKLTYEGKTYDIAFDNNVTSSVNLTKGQFSDTELKTSQIWNANYTVSGAKSKASAAQVITITYEKPQDQITGWEYLNDILVRQGNDFKTTVFGKEIHSIAENNKETEAFRMRNVLISNSGKIVIFAKANVSVKSDKTNTSSINEGDWTGTRAARKVVYKVDSKEVTLDVAADVTLLYKKNNLKNNLSIENVSYTLNQVSTHRDGVFNVTIYNMVHTIVINGETFTSENEVEERILDMDYTFDGYEVDPDYVNMAGRTKVYQNPNRETGHYADCIVFRKIDDHSSKMFVGWYDGASTPTVQTTNFTAKAGELLSLVWTNRWEAASLTGSSANALKNGNYSDGYKYQSWESNGVNSFSAMTTNLEKYGNPYIESLIARDGYYELAGNQYK
ncbi:unknown [Proteobacteria bacterium CAG:495]|nr:unknown [Proteobacteria bacterium CAG:495]